VAAVRLGCQKCGPWLLRLPALLLQSLAAVAPRTQRRYQRRASLSASLPGRHGRAALRSPAAAGTAGVSAAALLQLQGVLLKPCALDVILWCLTLDVAVLPGSVPFAPAWVCSEGYLLLEVLWAGLERRIGAVVVAAGIEGCLVGASE
jgi:hypothetical protein